MYVGISKLALKNGRIQIKHITFCQRHNYNFVLRKNQHSDAGSLIKESDTSPKIFLWIVSRIKGMEM